MNEEIKTENVPVGIVTMLSEQQAKTNHRLVYAIVAVVVCWLLTIGGFLWYLNQYEVSISNFGNFENSKVNANKGQFNEKVDSFIINNGGKQ